MKIFKKIKKQVKKTGKKVGKKLQDTAQTVGDSIEDNATKVGVEVKEQGENVIDAVTDVVDKVEDGAEIAFEFGKEQAQKLLDTLNFKKQVRKKAEAWIKENKVPLNNMVEQLIDLEKHAPSPSLKKLKKHISSMDGVDVASASLIAFRSERAMQSIDLEAQKLIGYFQSASVQGGIEGNYVVGGTGAYGFAMHINLDNDPMADTGPKPLGGEDPGNLELEPSIRAIGSLGGDLGAQWGLSASMLMGYWRAEPKDMEGWSITFSGTVGPGGITIYFDFSLKFQGFILSAGMLPSLEAAVGVEGTKVFKKK